MKKNKTKQIAIIILSVILLAVIIAVYFLSPYFKKETNPSTVENTTESSTEYSNYAEELQFVLNNAINDKLTITEDSINKLIEQNKNGNYDLNVALNLIGTPICILTSYDSNTVDIYSDKNEINDKLNNVSKDTKYNSSSLIQLYWMCENGDAIITWIDCSNISTPKIIGVITSKYYNLSSIKMPTITTNISDFNELNLTKTEALKLFNNPTIYKAQYKLLNCSFVTKLMSSGYDSVWIEYIGESADSYTFIDTKDENVYLVYKTFKTYDNIPSYDQTVIDSIAIDMTLDDFKKLCSNAVKSKLSKDNNELSTTYTILSKNDTNTLITYTFKNNKLTSKSN